MENNKYIDQLALTARAASSLDLSEESVVVDTAFEIIKLYWHPDKLILIVGSISASVRLISSLIQGKDKDPVIIVLDANASYAVPILGGHKSGGEDIALQIAKYLSCEPVITGNTYSQSFLALDSFGSGWGWKRSGKASDWKQLMYDQACNLPLSYEQASGNILWKNSVAFKKSFERSDQKNLLDKTNLYIGPKSGFSCAWHPATLWIGIGCERNSSSTLLERALIDTLEQSGLAIEAIAGLTTIDIKSDEKGLLMLSEKYNLPIRFFSANQLSKIDVPNPSKIVELSVETSSVSEAACILAAGSRSRLIVQKKIYSSINDESGGATISIAESANPFAPSLGEIHLVGSGPGDLSLLTADAQSALSKSLIWIGYSPYLDLLEPLRRSDQVRIEGALTKEKDRCNQALELAIEGGRVALISSGDTGIYGMAGLALELLLQENCEDRPYFQIHPGISCVNQLAARIGAPLMNDFCTISLSDKLTAWDKIIQRLEGAAKGDFVIAIYNPRSLERDWQLEYAVNLLKEHRPPSTPVVMARQISRRDESIKLFSLDNIPLEEVDMLTVLIVGNHSTENIQGFILTPRGY